MNLTTTIGKSDLIGASASGLCLLHCIATPFLFVAQASSVASHHHGTPFWWGTIDILFIAISLVAVYFSARNSSEKWMKYALYLSWLALSLIIVNEKMELFHLAEAWIYVPALGLVFLHLYNRKYCQCKETGCEIC